MFKIILLIDICAVVYVHSSLNNWFDGKIYTFAFPGIQPGSFFNGTHLAGPRVELMKEVCCIANKRCDAALVDFIRCWNDNNQSDVLNGRWYDVCAQLSTIKRREVSYAFSEISFLDVPNPAVVVRKNSNVTLDDLRNPRNELKLALMSVPELGTAGVLNVFRDFFFIQPENVISLKRGAGNDVTSEILRLINDPCSGVDLGIVVTALAKKDDPFKILFELPVDLGKSTLMVRKDDQHILEWWDYALRKFMCSKEYKKFCKRMDKVFGANVLNCPDPKQVNCAHDCEIRMRVPVCDGCEKDKDKKDKDKEKTTSTTEEPTTSTQIKQTTPTPVTTEATTSEETTATEQTSQSSTTTTTTTSSTTETVTSEPHETEEHLNKTTKSVTQGPTPLFSTPGVTKETSEHESVSNQSSTEFTTSSTNSEGTKEAEGGSTSAEDESETTSGRPGKIVSVATATASQFVTDRDWDSASRSATIAPRSGRKKRG